MAVHAGRIIAVGSNDDIRKLKGSHTQVVELGGHFVMPGFNDAHVHLAAGGLRHFEIDLTGTRSLVEMQERLIDDEWVALKPRWEKYRHHPISAAYVWQKPA